MYTSKYITNTFIKNNTTIIKNAKTFYNFSVLKKSFNITNFNNNSLNHYLSFIKQSKRYFSSVYVNHKDSFENNEKAPFDFTKDNYEKVNEILVMLQ